MAFVDLLDSLPAAERRAAPPIDAAIHVDLTGPSGDLRPSIITSAPARVIWSTRFPSRARLDTAVMLVDRAPGVPSAGAAARIGISDDRYYEELIRIPLDGTAASRSWRTISIDLRPYSGWQWSLFYRPWEKTWRLIFNADAVPDGAIAWARPMVSGG